MSKVYDFSKKIWPNSYSTIRTKDEARKYTDSAKLNQNKSVIKAEQGKTLENGTGALFQFSRTFARTPDRPFQKNCA